MLKQVRPDGFDLQLARLRPYQGGMPRISITMLRIAFYAAALFSLFMAGLPQAPVLPGEINDKFQHMLAFVTLAALGSAAYPRTNLFVILIGLSAFGGAIELYQMLPSVSRDSSWWDWAADTLAAGSVLSFVHLLRAKRRAETLEEA
jgi:hypothetical protein